MNILCCFKIVNDLDLIMERDWDAAGSAGLDLSYAKKIINCFDEAGLETALRIKESAEKSGEAVSITAVTIGNGNFDGFFKNLFAVGIDKIIQIKSDTASPFNPKKTAEILCKAALDSDFNLIICGKQSADGASGMTPYLLARELSIPCISNVTELKYENGAIRALCDTGAGSCKKTVHIPALYTIGNSANPYLRMATLKRKLAVSKMSAEILELSEKPEEAAEPIELSRQKSTRKCVFIEGKTCAEMAKKLLADHPEVRNT
ncbi:MAG: hypothetical protein RSE64_07130 [Oscillospiraceae bacterium]